MLVTRFNFNTEIELPKNIPNEALHLGACVCAPLTGI